MPRLRHRTVPTATAAGLVAAVVLTTPATPAAAAPGAAPARAVYAVSADGVLTPAGVARSRVVSDTLAGYLLTKPVAAPHRLRTTVVVPAVDCTGTSPTAVFVSALLYGRESAGDEPDVALAAVQAQCTSTDPAYSVFVSTTPAISTVPVTVRPGDVLTLDVAASGRASSARILDARGRVVAVARDTGFRVTGVYAAVQDGYGDSTPPRYRPVPFTATEFDGAPYGDAAPARLVQRASDGTLIAAPTPFTAQGSAFTVKRAATA